MLFKNLYLKQQVKLDKWSKLIAERDGKILEALKKSQGPVDFAVTALTSAVVRPLVGGAAGGTTAGILLVMKKLIYYIGLLVVLL